MEEGIKWLFDNNEDGVFSKEEFISLKDLQGKNKALPDKEKT